MDEGPPKLRLERLPKRDAVTRVRAVYTILERGWRARQPEANQQPKTETMQQEEV